jgi:hypothetical protein
MKVWSGGAYDNDHDRLMVFGGGHGGYGGNEMYAFDVNTLAWSRLTDPSPNPGSGGRPYYPDGLPTSRHTYDQMEYVPRLNAVCTFGVDGNWAVGGGSGDSDCFNLTTHTWSPIAPIGGGIYSGKKCAYDPNRKLIWEHRRDANPGGGINVFDPATNRWKNFGRAGTLPSEFTNMVFDPVRDLLVIVGGGKVMTWRVTGSGGALALSQQTLLSTTGDLTAQIAGRPTAAYDSKTDRIVAWNGGTNVYALKIDPSLATGTWTLVSPGPQNTVTPSPPQAEGTYGRFQYIPSKDLFILVNAVTKNVYFYKLGVRTSSPPPAPPSSPKGLRIQ